jgi:hypothetical protein
MPSSCREDKEETNAPQSPSMTAPTKASRNSDAAHGESDGEQTESEIEVEEEVEGIKEKGKSNNYQGYLKFEVQATWVTGPDTVLEDADINNQITQRMKKFMEASRLFKTPGHRPKPTDIGRWKQYSQPYLNSRTMKLAIPGKTTTRFFTDSF